MTDCQLLERYVEDRDEASFRALVVRHGPMVLKACRRVLRDRNEVEDAFQATFMVLVRKASSIRDPDTLGNWLYGVAFRVSVRLRRGAERRKGHERRRAELMPALSGNIESESDHPWDDLNLVVREELGLLPEPYRAPLELCYLLGRSHEEAADELGWPLGTVKTRLVRGRHRLRDRLDRRGIALGIGLLLALLRPRQARASDFILFESTARLSTIAPSGWAGLADPCLDRVFRLASAESRSRASARVAALLTVLLLAFCSAGLATLAGRAQAAETEQFAALPANLIDVLNVECR